MGWVVKATLPPVKRPGTHCMSGWVSIKTGTEILATTGNRSPDRPDHSEEASTPVCVSYSSLFSHSFIYIYFHFCSFYRPPIVFFIVLFLPFFLLFTIATVCFK